MYVIIRYRMGLEECDEDVLLSSHGACKGCTRRYSLETRELGEEDGINPRIPPTPKGQVAHNNLVRGYYQKVYDLARPTESGAGV